MKPLVKIGTRGSPLALYQTEVVSSKLRGLFPLVQVEIVKIHTKGDMIRRGGPGLIGARIFTQEIEKALLAKEIDLAVHSAKDLATELPAGLEIGAVLEREDPRDCLVARGGQTLRQLPQGAQIGTSSLRRKSQLKRLRRDLQIIEVRGNIETRLRKVEEGTCDGVVLAHAGLKRLGLADRVTEVFDEELFLPQAGQGTIAVEVRKNELQISEMVKPFNCMSSFYHLLAERSFLGRLEGGCQVPVGVSSKIEGNSIVLKAAIFSLDGEREISATLKGTTQTAGETGIRLADQLLTSGGREILDEIRSSLK